MGTEKLLQEKTIQAVKELFDADMQTSQVLINETRKEFEGDLTVVVFPIVKLAKKSPEQTGELIGQYLLDNVEPITGFNVIKGFLNLSFSDDFWIEKIFDLASKPDYGFQPSNGKKVVLEYCGPNTNKPIHLGHIRNMVLGYSVANLLRATGYEVHKVNILNDRGIAICKSMLAWQKFANGETPESTDSKGDHFVGKYYVKFSSAIEEEYEAWQPTEAGEKVFQEWLSIKAAEKESKKELDADQLRPMFFKQYKNDYFNAHSQLGAEAKEMLQKWEANDRETLQLWKQMNDWVEIGFAKTFNRLGIDFAEVYKESDFYKSGKKMVQDGVKSGTFYKKEDGSIWADLTDYKMDQKLLLRGDGTSVYLTQDIGVAQARYDKYKMDLSVYTVADEQNYHFKALQAVLNKMGKDYADGIMHLSYGMIDLPGGAKMKSREGTVVDADDLIDEVVAKAKESTEESGKVDDFSAEETKELYEIIGIGALRFFILFINPKKRMVFNPEDSVKLEGNTAPFIQYSYARTQSVLRKYGKELVKDPSTIGIEKLEAEEKELIQLIGNFEKVVADAAKEYDPSIMAQYTYNLAKTFNKFWHTQSILKADSEAVIDFRVLLSSQVGLTIKKGLELLGIKTTSRM